MHLLLTQHLILNSYSVSKPLGFPLSLQISDSHCLTLPLSGPPNIGFQSLASHCLGLHFLGLSLSGLHTLSAPHWLGIPLSGLPLIESLFSGPSTQPLLSWPLTLSSHTLDLTFWASHSLGLHSMGLPLWGLPFSESPMRWATHSLGLLLTWPPTPWASYCLSFLSQGLPFSQSPLSGPPTLDLPLSL